MNRVSALIPARGGSVRVPNKNLKILGGLTLIGRKILQLRQAGIEHIYVGSDSVDILKEAKKYGARVIERDPIACDESLSSANVMIKDFVSRVNAEHIIWAHCTNPFIYKNTYRDAINKYFCNLGSKYDSLISVTKIQSHMWNKFGFPVNYDPHAERHTLAKDLDFYYFQDGGFFIQPYAAARENSYFFGLKPYLFEVDSVYGFDINTTKEFEVAELLVDALDASVEFKRDLKFIN